MVKVYEPTTSPSQGMSWDGLMEHLRNDIDYDRPGDLEKAVGWLQDLASDPDFLWSQLTAELSRIEAEGEPAFSFYGSNSFIIHEEPRFFLRGNFWVPRDIISEGTEGDFAFELPHDHNFDFLSFGWGGPGYTTKVFTPAHTKKFGVPGEKLALGPVEVIALSPGRILFFQRFDDIHTQLPPEALSLSLNIIARPKVDGEAYQYAYDVDRERIVDRMNPLLSESLICIARCFDHPDLFSLVQELAAAHPCVATRLEAIKYLECSDPDVVGAFTAGPISQVTHYARRRVRERAIAPACEG